MSHLFLAADEQAVSIRGQSARALVFRWEFPQNDTSWYSTAQLH